MDTREKTGRKRKRKRKKNANMCDIERDRREKYRTMPREIRCQTMRRDVEMNREIETC